MLASPDAEARTSKKYVRTFIFSMRTGTPIEKLHVVTKFLMIAVMSVLALYMFDIPVSKGGPDIIGLILLFAIVFSLLIISGTAKYLANSYLGISSAHNLWRILLLAFFQWLATRSKNDFLPVARVFSNRSINIGFSRRVQPGLL